MPAETPGTCAMPGCPHLHSPFSQWCAAHEAELAAELHVALDEPPVRADDTPVVRPARLAPPRWEPAWVPSFTTIECPPDGLKANWLMESGYRLLREWADPNTLQVFQTWVKGDYD